jgi:glycosyltransferase involved in cell wall biosynthesis
MLLNQQDIIITDSEHCKKDIVDILHVPEEKVKVVYPILPHIFLSNTTPSKPQLEIPNKYCIYVGDVTWNKNIVNLAKAIKIANIPCIFVGKAFGDRVDLDHPEKRELKSFLKEIENNPNFIFPGFISDEELLWLYQHAVCNILVSRDEGFGFSFLEAASQKLPSILSDTPIFRETAQDTALFADTENPQDIAEKITTIANNMELRTKLSAKAENRSLFFSPSYFKTTLLGILS